MCEITLTNHELLMASSVGTMRNIASIKAGARDNHGAKIGYDWTTAIEGACGELAAARALGRYWNGSINTFKDDGDIGYNLEVRTTHYQNGCLIVRPADKDESIYLLVIGVAPRYRVVGWIVGGKAKTPEWLSSRPDGRPAAWFVPQHALHPIAGMLGD